MSTPLTNLPIILGSSSPRRRELLGWTGLPFEVARPDIDESVHPGEIPADYVLRLCYEKASAIAASLDREAIIITADTTVALNREIIGKPDDAEHAVQILRHLRGKTHQVHTGVCVMAHRTDIDSTRTDVVTSNVTMRNMTDDEIAAYVASGEPFGKAGGYGIQDRTFRPVERLDGCYTNVVGFPMCIVTRLLHARKFEIAVTLCSPKHLPCIYEPRD